MDVQLSTSLKLSKMKTYLLSFEDLHGNELQTKLVEAPNKDVAKMIAKKLLAICKINDCKKIKVIV